MAKLWGGRFSKDTDKLVEDFHSSISFDQKLYKWDITGSKAHAHAAQHRHRQNTVKNHRKPQTSGKSHRCPYYTTAFSRNKWFFPR